MATTPPYAGTGPSSLFGSFLQNNSNTWLKDALTQILNNSVGANQFGLDRGLPFSDQLGGAASNLINLGQQFSFGAPGSDSGGAFTQLSDRLNNIFKGLNPSQFQQNGLSQQSQQSLGNLANIAGGLQPNIDALSGIMQSGGQTGQSNDLSSFLQSIYSGQSAPMQTQVGTGMDLLTGQGQNPMTMDLQNIARAYGASGGSSQVLQAASNQAQKLMAENGMTPQLASLFGQGNSIFSSGGMTPQTQAGIGSALQGFQGGGATPFLQQMQQNGLNISGQNPLLPSSLVASFARDQASRNMKDQAKAFAQQAMNRGGGPGSVVANGTTNEALADFADQGTGNISQAVQNALLQSQGLGLQEQGLGANMGLGAAGTQAGQLGTYGGALSSLAGVGNQRLGLGMNASTNAADSSTQALLASMGLLPTVQNSSTNLMGTTGQLGLGAGQLALGNMSEGGNLVNAYNQNQLGAGGLMNNLFGNQNQFALGAGQLANQGYGTQGGILNNVAGGQISGDQLGLGQANSYQQALSSLLGMQGNVAGQGLGLISAGMQPLGGLTQNWTNYASNGLGLQKGLFNAFNPTNPFGQFLSQPNTGTNLGISINPYIGFGGGGGGGSLFGDPFGGFGGFGGFGSPTNPGLSGD